MKKYLISFAVMICAVQAIFSQSLSDSLFIGGNDLRLVYEEGSDFSTVRGYHLYIRKKSGIESVMLTETTKDPEGSKDNYAYRAGEYNSVNGDEKRFLNGKLLESQLSKYSLIDSTPEVDREFGLAFHIYIPSEIYFGYEWSRHGTVKIGKGTFINIRSFEKKYGDYSGNYSDNPFMFDLGKAQSKPAEKVKTVKNVEKKTEKKAEAEVFEEPIVLTDDYNPVAAAVFSDIANFNGGEMVYSKGPDTIIDDIMASLERINPKEKADVIFAVDATGSMKDDVQKLRDEWIPRLIEALKGFGNVRLGLLLYRDYNDTFRLMGLPVKKFEFTDKVEVFNKNLNAFVIHGNEGGDVPEAVYEALYAGLTFYNWRNDAYRKIILIGDAEPHPSPRGTGRYTKKLVADTAVARNVIIDAIIVPDNKTDRGR
jgi:hypothetical protein